MSIIDFKKVDKKPTRDLAQEMYEKQLKAIINISHTDGYKEIKEYWNRVKEGAEGELKTIPEEFLKIVQMKCRIAEDFLTFLSNLEKAKETQKKARG